MTVTPFHKLSEATGVPVSSEGASMMVTRYLMATRLAAGRRTLEIACASGPGLGMLSRAASFVVGADISEPMLRQTRAHYGNRIPLARLSAEALPFRDASFDFVLLMEASYYVRNFGGALAEIDRVLSAHGRILFVNANPERADFIRSPFSHHYHSADEMRALLSARGFRVEVSGAFPVDGVGGAGRGRMMDGVFRVARRTLETFHLVPRTLHGRARLKRLLGARLVQVPAEIDESFAERATIVPRPAGPLADFKVFYVVAERGP